MSFWNSLKKFGRNVGKFVSRIGNPVRNTIRKALNFTRRIPIIGKMTDDLIARNPLISKIGDVANTGLNVANKLAKDDFKGAGKEALRGVVRNT